MGFSKDCGSWSDNRKNTRFSQKDIIRKKISRTTISRIADKNKDVDLQRAINSNAQRREIWLIHDKLEEDIKEFLKSDDSKPSDSKPYLHVVGNTMLDWLVIQCWICCLKKNTPNIKKDTTKMATRFSIRLQNNL